MLKNTVFGDTERCVHATSNVFNKEPIVKAKTDMQSSEIYFSTPMYSMLTRPEKLIATKRKNFFEESVISAKVDLSLCRPTPDFRVL